MKNILKKNKAITLIALVITIVILIILAGVAINLTLGNNGLFTRAQVAKQRYEYSTAKEILDIKLAEIQSECLSNDKEYNLEAIVEELKKDSEATIEIIYWYGTAKISDSLDIENKPSTLSGIVVTIDEYTTYKFLIGKKSEDSNSIGIIGVSTTKSNTPEEKDFTEVEEYEKTVIGEVINTTEGKEAIPKENYGTDEYLVLLEHFEEEYEQIPHSKISEESKKIGTGSLILDNTNIVSSQQIGASDDFTVEFWIYLSSSNINAEWRPFMSVPVNDGLWLGLHSGNFVVRGWGSKDYLATDTPPTDTWTHIAVCRKDNALSVYFDGILKKSINNSTNFSTGHLYFGNDNGGNYTQNSFIDELRISTNTALYDGNFTPNTSAFEKNNNNNIIYHFDADIKSDNTSLTDSIKKFGNKSMYLNNAERTYNTNDNFKIEGNFTVDFWIYLSSTNINAEWNPIMTVPVNEGLWLGLHSGKFTVRGWGDKDYLSADTPPTDTWTHIAVCRKDNVLYIFYNGQLQKQIDNSTVFNKGELTIGSDKCGNYINDCYLDELRILNGYAQWTSSFTPPTSEYSY